MSMAGPDAQLHGDSHSEHEGYLPSDASVLDPRSSKCRGSLDLARNHPLEALLEFRASRRGGASRSGRSQHLGAVQSESSSSSSSKAQEFEFILGEAEAAPKDAMASQGSHGGSDRPSSRRTKQSSNSTRQRSNKDFEEVAAEALAAVQAEKEKEHKEQSAGALGLTSSASEERESSHRASARGSRGASHQRRRGGAFKAKGAINRSSSEGAEELASLGSQDSDARDSPTDSPVTGPFWEQEDRDFDCEFRDWVMEGLDMECGACGALHSLLQKKAPGGDPLSHGIGCHSATCRTTARADSAQLSCSSASHEPSGDSKEEVEVDGSMTFKMWRQATSKADRQGARSVVPECCHRGDVQRSGSQQRSAPQDPWAKVELGEDKGLSLEVCNF